MRLVVPVLLAALATAFLVGRATATPSRHVWTGRQGDPMSPSSPTRLRPHTSRTGDEMDEAPTRPTVRGRKTEAALQHAFAIVEQALQED